MSKINSLMSIRAGVNAVFAFPRDGRPFKVDLELPGADWSFWMDQ